MTFHSPATALIIFYDSSTSSSSSFHRRWIPDWRKQRNRRRTWRSIRKPTEDKWGATGEEPTLPEQWHSTESVPWDRIGEEEIGDDGWRRSVTSLQGQGRGKKLPRLFERFSTSIRADFTAIMACRNLDKERELYYFLVEIWVRGPT